MNKKETPPKRRCAELKNKYKNFPEEKLLAELKKPHTSEEYEAIHKALKRIYIKDAAKQCIFPVIALITSIVALITSFSAVR